MPAPLTLTARWILTMSGEPIERGRLVVEDDRIAAIDAQRATGSRVRDLGNVALLPALINAHTHLEFSSLDRPLGNAGEPLPDWIGRVIAWRQARDRNPSAGSAARDRAMRRGLDESWSRGVSAVGEIVTPAGAGAGWPTTRIGGVRFLELLGLDPSRTADLLDLGARHLGERTGPLSPGLSPHAPYTVGLEAVAGIVELAAREDAPVAMHLAESREELRLLESHRGPFRERLEAAGAWAPGAIPPGSRPLDYLRLLADAPRALVIHGNYLDTREQQLLADHRATMSLVYCPRTHAYFGHDAYPLPALLQRGVRVLAGTDSRASNPDLDLLAELRSIRRTFPGVDPSVILQMGTIEAARALRLENEFGCLRVGGPFDAVMVPVDDAPADPCRAVLDGTRPAVRVTVGEPGAA